MISKEYFTRAVKYPSSVRSARCNPEFVQGWTVVTCLCMYVLFVAVVKRVKCQRHVLWTSFDIFGVIYRAINFLKNWSICYYFLQKKPDFFQFPIFRCCPFTLIALPSSLCRKTSLASLHQMLHFLPKEALQLYEKETKHSVALTRPNLESVMSINTDWPYLNSTHTYPCTTLLGVHHTPRCQ